MPWLTTVRVPAPAVRANGRRCGSCCRRCWSRCSSCCRCSTSSRGRSTRAKTAGACCSGPGRSRSCSTPRLSPAPSRSRRLPSAVPLAWLTSRTDLPGRAFWSAAASLPLVIPSYIGAVVMVAAFGPRGMLQSALAPLGVERLPSIYGFTGSWLTLTLFTYPYVYLTVRAALRNLDPSLEEAARCLGYGPWRTFFAVTLPQLRPAAAAGRSTDRALHPG